MRRDHTRRLTVGLALAVFLLLPGPVTSAPPMAAPPPTAELPAVAPDPEPGRAPKLIDMAATAIGESRYADAEALLSEAIDGNALSPMQRAAAHHYRGIARQKSGASGAAVLDYNAAIESGVLPPEIVARVHYNRALAKIATGDRLGAERDYTDSIDLVPDYAPAWHNRANLERERADYATAIRDYGEAIARLVGAQRKLPLLGRALAYEKSGDLAAAAADLREALAADPQFDVAQAKLREIEPRLARAADDGLATGAISPAAHTLEISPRNGWSATAVRYEERPAARVEPAATTPEKTPPTAALTPSQAAPSTAAAGDAGPKFRVQLGAFRAADDAAKAWNDLRMRHDTLAALEHRIEEADLGAKGIYFRLQAGAFKTRSEARSLCARLKADRLDCMIAGG